MSAVPSSSSARSVPARRTALWPIAAAGAAALVVAGASLAAHGADAEGLRLLNRYLARLSFCLFAPIYAASSLARLAPGAPSRWLMRRRRSLGLAYALVMACHAVAIVARWRQPDVPFDLNLSVVGGGIGFVFIAAQAATSNDASVRRLGAAAWRRLHGVGVQVLWFIYAFTYLGRVATDGSDAPGLAVALALPVLRLAARRRRPSPA